MSTITWLHLSDLHIQGTEGIRDRVLFDKMLSDIQTCLEEENLELDAVFFTGDLAFSGQQEEYTPATEMLDEILDKCGLTGRREKLFIVPGNHDVDWSAVRDSHKSFANDLLDPREETDESKQYARMRGPGSFRGFAISDSSFASSTPTMELPLTTITTTLCAP
jgi:3',5'-cyclic AMP phosphodiesterase CpdA